MSKHAPSDKAKTETSDREIVITRLLDAPRELVFDAWTDPKHIVKWWGPNGFSTTIEEMDLRVGGAWNHVMHGPDGTDYPNSSIFTEIVRPERISYSHAGGKKGATNAQSQVTATFEEVGDKTLLTLRMIFITAEVRDRVIKEYGAIEGGKQTLGRLADFLSGQPAFFISREFDAPRELVWKCFTESDRLARWWGPKGFEMLQCTVDLRPGGICLYGMRAPNGMEMWGKFVYCHITAPQRLVFINSFSDKDGSTQRHFASPTWPREVLNVMTLVESEGRTTLALRGGPINATEEERKTFEAGFDSMRKGFGGTLDQLAEYLDAADHSKK
jgi:uncharacterized protein YndB with AHSA1/START domain